MAQNIGEAQIGLSVDTSRMERDVSAALKRLESRGFNLGAGINAKSFTQPLGRITGAANEFQKSLDASNARVIAFGASAGAIYNVQRAFTALIGSTIDVQKSLTDINVILGASSKTLGQFSDQLFEIARNSGQAFSTVATAAGELARQGLSVEQTLKRTSDALILARLSGLDAASSVEALTASINSFNNSALDSTQIVNKLASVDAAFAVSSADLAEALKRVGSSAQDVGVNFDELLAIVASVNQTTARGGAVIGNSLKTIFTRVQRPEVLNQLESLGVAVRDLQGNTAPAIQILTGLAQKFDGLADAQKSQVAELVGGVFQINVLKAALGDLSREYSVYGNALKISTNASNEAIVRNQELNKTLAALLNRTLANLTKVGSEIGALSFQPAIEKVLGGLNTALEGFDVKGDSIGSKIGKGIFEGIGSFISGPGLALLIGVFGKIFLNLGKFTSDAIKTVLGLNREAQTQAQIQERINSILSQNPALVQNILNKQISLLQVEKDILTIIEAQAQARKQSTAIATTLTQGLISRGVTAEKGVITTTRAKSQGFIPNFNANREIMGAIAGGYMPGQVRSMNIPNYGRVTYNDAETVKQFSGLSQPGIMPPANSDAGKAYKQKFKDKYGIDPYASSGFIPNFAGERTKERYPYVAVKSTDRKALSKQFKASEEADASDGYTRATKKGNIVNSRSVDRYGALYPSFSQNVPGKAVGISGGNKYGFITYPFPGGNFDINENLYETVRQNLINISSDYFKQLITQPKIIDTTRFKTNIASNLSRSAVESSLGQVFEAGIKSSISSLSLSETANFDLNKSELSDIQQKFQLPYGGFGSTYLADLKNSLSEGNLNSMAGKISTASGEKFSAQDTIRAKKTQSLLQKEFTKKGYEKLSGAEAAYVRSGKFKSRGFIPNFSPLDKALSTEGKMGGRGVLDFKPGLGLYVRDGKTQPNFAAVMRDHPEGIGNAIKNSKIAQGLFANQGFVPNMLPIRQAVMSTYGKYVGPAGSLTQMVRPTISGTSLAGGVSDQSSAQLQRAIDKITRSFDKGSLDVDQATKQISNRLQSYTGVAGKKLAEAETSISKTLAARQEVSSKGFIGSAIGGISNLNTKFENTTFGKISKGLESKALVASFAAPIVAETIGNFIPGGQTSRGGRTVSAAASGIGDIASYASIGSLFGPIGTAVGGIVGTISAGTKVWSAFNDKTIDYTLSLDTAKQKLNDMTFAVQNINSATENLDRFQAGDFGGVKDPKTQAELIAKENEKLAEGLSKLDKSVRDQYLAFVKEGNKPEAQAILNMALGKAQQEAINRQSVLTLAQLEKDKVFKQLGQGGIQGLAAESQVKSAIEPLFKDLSLEQLKLIKETNSKDSLKTAIESALPKIPPELRDQLVQLLSNNRQLLDGVINIKEIARTINQDQKSGKPIGPQSLSDIQRILSAAVTTGKPLDLTGFNAKGILESPEITKAKQDEAIKSTTDAIMAFGLETNDTSKATQMITDYLQRATIIINDFNSGLISATEKEKRLGAIKEDILLKEQAKSLTSKDIASRKMESRNAQGIFQPVQSFMDSFGENGQTTVERLNQSFSSLAENIQTGFEDAFGAFVDGTKTADEAFQSMLLNISQQIIKEQFSIGMRSLLGGLTGGGGYGGTSDNGSGLLGGIFNSIFGGMGKAKGGIIKKYSYGGHVQGGSGVRDDVPAMLTGGEYVLRKNAVNKYGKGMLDMLNRGGMVRGYAGGGSVSSTLANQYDLYGPGGDLLMGGYTPEAFKRTITGPEQLGNVPDIKGVFNISDMLSSRAITDENNPMNQLRTEKFNELLGYQQNVSSFKTSYNESMRQVEEQRKQAQEEADRINAANQSAYNRQVTQGFIGGLLSVGLSAFGAAGGIGGLLGGTFGNAIGGAATGGAAASGGIFSAAGIGSIFQGVGERLINPIMGLFGGGGGQTTVGMNPYQQKEFQKSLTQSIQGSINNYSVTSPGLGALGAPGYGGYGFGMGGGGGGIQPTYYGAGAGANVGLYGGVNPFAAGLGFGTFTQNPNAINPYLVQPAAVIPAAGVIQPQPLNVGSVSFGRGFANGGIVKGYKMGGGVELSQAVINSIMRSEGRTGIQSGIREYFGFRAGTRQFKEIQMMVNKFGSDSPVTKGLVGQLLTERATNAGALNFKDPGVQAAVMSMAHMRGEGGAQAILNSVAGQSIKESGKLTQSTINKINTMDPLLFQSMLRQKRLEYDKAIYGNKIDSTVIKGRTVTGKWWDLFGKGLTNRYEREQEFFSSLSVPEFKNLAQNIKASPQIASNQNNIGVPISTLGGFLGLSKIADLGAMGTASGMRPLTSQPAYMFNSIKNAGALNSFEKLMPKQLVNPAEAGQILKSYNSIAGKGAQTFEQLMPKQLVAPGEAANILKYAQSGALKPSLLSRSLSGLKSFGAGMLKGAAFAPATEFLTPPSLGPTQGTIPYEIEMGWRDQRTGELTPLGKQVLGEDANTPTLALPSNQAPQTVTPGSLYDQVGLARNPLSLNPQIPSYLNRFAPFFGNGENYFNSFGRTGFNNYMSYLGLGAGTSLSSLSSFNFPMTPTTLGAYAFSNSPFGGSAVTYGTGVASASPTYFSAGSRLGATPSWASRATGGPIFGGSSYKDDVPAMLMGGEYVIRKDIVDRMGQPFFDRLNRGQVNAFADGGPVGTGLPSTASETQQNDGGNKAQFSDSFTKLVKSLDSLNKNIEEQTQGIKSQTEQQSTTTDKTSSNGLTNNITINVNVDNKGGTSETTDQNTTDQQGGNGNDSEKARKSLERSRALSELLKSQVLKVIVEEQRPGGVLYQGSKGRDLGR